MTLLIIDTQEMIVNDKLYAFDAFVSNIKTLLITARRNCIEVIYIRHDDGIGQELTKGKAGFEIYKQFRRTAGEKVFDKTVNSPFRGTGLLEYLNLKEEKQLIIAGLQTDYCFDAAVKCGFEHGFQIIVPNYANTTVDNEFMSGEDSYKYYNEFIWKGRYAKCLSMKDTLDLMENQML